MAIEFAGALTASSDLTQITSGSAGVKGSYTELIASTARESHLLKVDINTGSSDDSFQVFIAIDSGPEVDQFSFNFWGNSISHNSFIIPYTIAASTRVSAACLSNNGASNIRMSIALVDDDSWGTSTEATHVGSSGGLGVEVDPDGTANTKGGWDELSSSAPHDMDMLVVCIGQNGNASIATQYDFLVDIGVGASTFEAAVVENLYHNQDVAETGNTFHVITDIGLISSGDRISARCQCSNIADATDRLIDVSVLGVNLVAPSGGGGVAQALAY